MNFISEQNQPPDCTLYKKGTKPPIVTLDEVAMDLLLYIGGSPHLNKTEKEIEEKYNFKKQHNNCWSEDNIKRAWGKTQRMDKTLLKRKRWALAILLQVIKSSDFEFKRKRAQSDQNKAGDSIQSCAEESLGNTSEKNTVGSKGSASGSQLPSCSEKEYIRIPLSVMFRNESDSAEGGRKVKGSTTFKLIDRLPLCPEIKKRKSYVLLYNNQTRNATWVYEILNKSTCSQMNARSVHAPATTAVEQNEKLNKKIKYKDDIGIPRYYPAENMADFNESDYEHGHLAAAANHRWCKEAHEDTYFLSNIAPQTEYLNQEMAKVEDQWRKKIENDKDTTIRNVHVYTGPLYIKSNEKQKTETLKIWKTKVVPTHFFKVMIVEGENGTVEHPICYKLPNVKSEDEIKQSEDKNKRSKNKTKQSKNKNKQSKDKNKQSKDKNDQSKDKNKQSKDKNNENVLDRYIVSIKEIEDESGLRFTERACTEGEMDSTRTVKWMGKTEDENRTPPCVKISVRIITPLTDHNNFVYI